MIQDDDNKILERTEFVKIGKQIRDEARKIIRDYDAAVKYRREHPTDPDVKAFDMNQASMYMRVHFYTKNNDLEHLEVFDYLYNFPHDSNEKDLQDLVSMIVKDYIDTGAVKIKIPSK